MEGLWEKRSRGSIEPMPLKSHRRSGMKACFVNLEDERGLISLLGVTPMVARRLVIQRPLRDISQLLTVKGLSGQNLIEWETKGLSLDFSTSETMASRSLGGGGGSSSVHLRDSSNMYQPAAPLHVSSKPPQRQPQAEPPSPHGEGRGEAAVREQREEELQSSMRDVNEFLSRLQASCANLEHTGGRTLTEVGVRHWVMRVQESRLEGIERGVLRRTIRSMFRGWRAVVLEKGGRSLLEYRILRKRVRSALVLSFRSWLAAKRRYSRSRRVGVHTLSRILNEARRAAFREWHRVSRTGVQIHAVQVQSVSLSTRRHLAEALQAWMLSASARKALMVRVQRGQERWRRSELRRRLGAWGLFCGERQRLKRGGIRLMLRWLTMIGHTSLLRWRDVCVCRMRQRRVWEGLRMRVGQGLMRSVMLEWRFCRGVGALQTNHAAQVIGSFVGGVARRTHKVAARACLAEWRHRVAERKAQKLGVWRKLRRHRVSAATEALEAWHLLCLRRARLHDKGVKVLVKSLRGTLRWALWTWWETKQSRAHLSWSSEKVSEATAHQAMSASLEGWRDHALRKKHFAGSGRGAGIHRLGQRRKLLVLTAWRDTYRRERRLQKLGIRMLVRWMRALIRSSFAAWSNQALEPVPGPGLHARDMAKGARRRVVGRAWEGWQGRVAQAQWERSVVVRIAVRWTLMGLKRSFWALHRNAARTGQLKASVTALMVRMLSAVCAEALSHWHTKTLESRRLWRAGTKLVARYIRNHALSALHAWWDVSCEGRRFEMGREFPYDGYNFESLSREKSLPANSSLLPEGQESPFVDWIQDADGVAAKYDGPEQEFRLNGSQREWMHVHAAQRLFSLALDSLLAWADASRRQTPSRSQGIQHAAGWRDPELIRAEGALQAASALPRAEWEITALSDVPGELRGGESSRADRVLKVLGEAGQQLMPLQQMQIPELCVTPFTDSGPQSGGAASAFELSPVAESDLAAGIDKDVALLSPFGAPR